MSTAQHEDMTKEILAAFDEIDEDEPVDETPSADAEPVATTVEEDEDQDEASAGEELEVGEETPSEEEEEEAGSLEEGEEAEDEEESEEEAEEEEPSGDEEAPEASAFSSDDPDVLAFLARHGNDPEAALKAAARFENVLGRQGRELGQLRERNAQLEADLERATLFAQATPFLSAEQQQWVEEATTSEQPLAYIQAAVHAGEFELARAVLDGVELPAGQAVRTSQAIDRAEVLAAPEAQEEAQPLSHDVLMNILVEHYPEMPQYETEMVSTIKVLGMEHPLVALAHSQDPGQAAQGIIGLYEIARAKTATVTSTREQVKQRTKKAADDVRARAQVTSGAAAPSQAQAARAKPLMPGLTLEALEAEFETE